MVFDYSMLVFVLAV
ncbi:hypothetical protein VCHC17A1_4132A, partial [Vibrio cholerae HC-17A1]